MTDNANNPKDAIRRAVALRSEGKTDAAEAAFRHVLKQSPDHPAALHFLGLLVFEKGGADEAAALVARAVARDDGNPLYAANLGHILAAAGRWREAANAFGRAVALDPGAADPHFQLGECLQRLGRADDAAAQYRAALSLDPRHMGAGNSLGVALEEQGRIKEAEAVYRRTLKAAGAAPDLLYNLGNVLRDRHRADAAIAAYRHAIRLNPDFAEAHVHLAYALLLKGDYRPAWKEYEWRWRLPAFAGTRRGGSAPAWDGGPLRGRTLLLWAEQGFGDTLQFARYAGVAADMGGRVIVECQPALARLMKSAAGVAGAVARGRRLPPFDVQAPLLSVPGLLGTTLKTVPRDVPYLAAEPALAAKWRKRFANTPGLKVGIAWRGTAERRGNPARACPLAAFAPLGAVRNVRLFSLQKDVPAEDRPLPKGIADLSRRLGDFADTAAIIAALDAVVSIDTAVAHLAGAMGKPTLLILSTAGDWRWLMRRATSPWYPSMRIFRQGRPGDWAAVMDAVAGALAGLAAEQGRKAGAAEAAKPRRGKAPRRGRRRAARRPARKA